MSLMRQTHSGKEYASAFGERMRGTGAWAQLLRDRFRLASRKYDLTSGRGVAPVTALFRPPARGGQIGLDF